MWDNKVTRFSAGVIIAFRNAYYQFGAQNSRLFTSVVAKLCWFSPLKRPPGDEGVVGTVWPPPDLLHHILSLRHCDAGLNYRPGIRSRVLPTCVFFNNYVTPINLPYFLFLMLQDVILWQPFTELGKLEALCALRKTVSSNKPSSIFPVFLL